MPKSTKKKTKKSDAGRHIYKGKLEVTRSGMGFVKAEGLEKDIMIERDNMLTALNGDEVRVEVKGYFDNNKRVKGTLQSTGLALHVSRRIGLRFRHARVPLQGSALGFGSRV